MIKNKCSTHGDLIREDCPECYLIGMGLNNEKQKRAERNRIYYQRFKDRINARREAREDSYFVIPRWQRLQNIEKKYSSN